jgi:hypothetical protein
VEFAVANIRDIEWSSSSFDDVKIPEAQEATLGANRNLPEPGAE